MTQGNIYDIMLSQKREDINNIKYILTQAYHPERQKWHRKPKLKGNVPE